jgi:hypothetical protein
VGVPMLSRVTGRERMGRGDALAISIATRRNTVRSGQKRGKGATALIRRGLVRSVCRLSDGGCRPCYEFPPQVGP